MIDAVKIGSVISSCRREKGFTQEDLAVRLAVTSQAVSKWERGVSFPDIDFLPDISRLLDVSVDDLLAGNMPVMISVKQPQAHQGSISEHLSMLLPDELMILVALNNLGNKEFCNPLIEKIKDLRPLMATRFGILLPIIRIRDWEMEYNTYEIRIRRSLSVTGKIETVESGADLIINHLMEVVRDNPDVVVTRQMVKALVDNLEVKHPTLVEEMIPARLTYGRLRRILVGILKGGRPINDLVTILEVCDETLDKSTDDAELIQHILPNIKR